MVERGTVGGHGNRPAGGLMRTGWYQRHPCSHLIAALFSLWLDSPSASTGLSGPDIPGIVR